MPSNKRDTVLDWIQRGIVRVHFDATRSGAVVPRYLRKRENLSFDWGLDMPIPIPDLKIDQEAISGTLSFGVGNVFCVVPWGAVFVVQLKALDKAELWLNDAPASVQREILDRAGGRANEKLQRARFRVIEGEKGRRKS